MEIPVSKLIRSTQVHRDYFPIRSAGGVVVSASPLPHCNRFSPADSRESGNSVLKTQVKWGAMPAQLVASASFSEVPVLRSSNTVGKRSKAVQQARAELKHTRKSPIFRVVPMGRQVDFEPYTMQDYQKLKPAFSKAMGGLGPARVGTEDWTLGIRKLQRIRKFAEGLRRSHTIDPCHVSGTLV
jgi:hypothetical protein